MSADRSASGVISSSFAAASAERSSAPTVSPERAEKINSWAKMATEKVGQNYEQTRHAWVNQKYGELLARDGERLSLKPAWAVDDRKAHLMRTAEYIVRRRFEERLSNINRVAEKLLAGQTLAFKTDDRGR
ncbi:hypothetical protein [Sphingobium sp. HWE2-09]|uniref:hypothetical protein n=1 Tax=Sphingobium sp. HWE2-09 TaxID=3108390 RepID=UPI002DD1F6A2|nr:hypothetical protein [Sphingobium sp. HWE2-09]